MSASSTCEGEVEREFDGYTAILPTVSAANVAQMAVDMIATLPSFSLHSHLSIPHVVDFVGCDPTACNQDELVGRIGSSLELYVNREDRLVMLQQRAPALNGMSQTLSEECVKYLTDRGVASFLVAVGFDLKERCRSRDFDVPGALPNIGMFCRKESELPFAKPDLPPLTGFPKESQGAEGVFKYMSGVKSAGNAGHICNAVLPMPLCGLCLFVPDGANLDWARMLAQGIAEILGVSGTVRVPLSFGQTTLSDAERSIFA
ncbi:proteasome assembly chaperone 2 [Kipferlia bialata]|uniref:Proteasome assembly chaperone 2 n=1 Tax=Kipferlia bialata TaxID=797122 RepID=A0A9K3D134_9EUKA|nr:proteasome assembly chaperone 2 [Kipferlia bialata]|eukprot:g8674.t1